jgi:ribonuclease P protein component
LPAFRVRSDPIDRIAVDEADLPAQPDSSQTRARLSRPDEDPGRSCGPQQAARQGSEAAGTYDAVEVAVGAPTGRFRRTDRLLRPGEFQHVTRYGRRASVRGFVVFTADTAAPRAAGIRLGITVSRRVGNAVVRNRIKRRVREWFRRERGRLRDGVDVVVIGRAAAAELGWRESIREIEAGLRQTGALAS